jgi:hypothetical protein
VHLGLLARLTNCSYRLRLRNLEGKSTTVYLLQGYSHIANVEIWPGLQYFSRVDSNIAHVHLAEIGAKHERWHLWFRRLRGRNFSFKTRGNTPELDHTRWRIVGSDHTPNCLSPKRGHGLTLPSVEKPRPGERPTIVRNRMWFRRCFPLCSLFGLPSSGV